jgi:serine protease
MFDATTSNNSLEASNLISNDISLSKSDPFFNSTSQNQLLASENLALDYSDRDAVAINDNALDSQTVFSHQLGNTAFSTTDSAIANTALASLTTETSSDPLTGMAVNDSLVGTTASTSGSPLAAASASNVLRVVGNLRANRFTIPYPGYSYVISGNGNVDFGSGYRDYIDLYNISSKTVGFNLASATGGGVLYNPGNGIRVFDAMRLSNGVQILFEGIDSIRFREGLVNLSVQPNDPGFNSQWNLHMMGVQNAWRFSRGSTGILVGIEDSGLGVNSSGYIHPDLRSSSTIIYPVNYRDEFTSSFSHGTAVHGIIAAASNNGIGISGINWNSSVFSIDVLGGNAYDQNIAQATQNMINFANSRGQKLVINMSLTSTRSLAFEQLVANNRNNALFAIASGNGDAGSLSYPAWLAYYYDNVISVGASWGTSNNYGSATPGTRISYPGLWGSNYGPGLMVMGPSEVLTTGATGYSGSTYTFGYQGRFNGTSAATPNVAGVASLVWSANGNLSAAQVRAILAQTSFDLGAVGYDYAYGYGFVNADAAVRQAIALVRIGYSASSASPSASVGGNPLASNASLSATSFSVNTSESLEFGKDKTNSDRTYLVSSLFPHLQASSYETPNGTNTIQVVDLSKRSRLLGDGLDLYTSVGKRFNHSFA